jgi:hypothetical protein
MYTSTDMVSNAGYYRRIQCGHLFGRKSIVAVQTVNFTGMECREIFTFRVGPPIINGTGYIYGPRSNQGNQFVLVEGQGLFIIGKSAEVRTKPMWKAICNNCNCFAVCPFG